VRSEDVRSADIRCEDVRCEDVRYADVRSEDVRSADIRCEDVRCVDVLSQLLVLEKPFAQALSGIIHHPEKRSLGDSFSFGNNHLQ